MGVSPVRVADRKVSPTRVGDQKVLFLVSVAALGQAIADELARRRGVRVIGVVTSADAVLHAVALASNGPDIVVVDAGVDRAIGLVARLRSDHRDVRFVVVGVADEPTVALQWARLGVAALVSQMASLDELSDSVLSVAGGEASCSPRIAAALLNGLALPAKLENGSVKDGSLTHRERQVALLLADGLTNGEIAAQLIVELGTVKNHVHHVLTKLGVQRRSQVARALRRDHVA